jgi:Glycosyltransferase family 17
MAVIDVVTYNGEHNLLELRLNILDKHVDRFKIVEAKTTFSGKEKPLYFSAHEMRFKKWWHKIDFHVIDENYSKAQRQLAKESPNTMGAKHWQNEFLQKESIKGFLVGCADTDTLFIGDVDEVWDSSALYIPPTCKLKLRVYAYYLNNCSSEEFWGTIKTDYKTVKDACLNHLRTQAPKTEDYYGWHFTSMGGYAQVKRKLDDSYTKESYNTDEVQAQLQQRVKEGLDYLGRPFDFTLDEEDWPSYLRQNRHKYLHLCKKV